MFATRTLTALFAAALTAAAATAQPAPKADLIIQDITFNSNAVKLKTQNVGTAKAENFRVRLQIVASVGGSSGGSKVLFDQAKTFNRINAGDTETKDFDVNAASIQAQANAFKQELLTRVERLNVPAAVKARLKNQIQQNFRVQAVATADSDNQVNELNENNNARTETFPGQ